MHEKLDPPISSVSYGDSTLLAPADLGIVLREHVEVDHLCIHTTLKLH